MADRGRLRLPGRKGCLECSINMRHLFLAFTLLVSGALGQAAEQARANFNQAIRPILSDNCFACHGPDQNKRKGKLRLDVREDAIAKKAIVPGKPDESELIARISSRDPDELMPPAETHKVLSGEQKELLREWIAAGAEYERHWAFIPPVKMPTPVGKNAIDYLVEKRAKSLGLESVGEAEPRILARRLHFDLVGLPPKPEEVEAFERNHSPEAYARLVERLLGSPHYGERMAIGWLDVARFADTIGYHSDNPRNVWPYRDYVIRAFNDNKPFDQFTREQIAGDLLPGAVLEQKIGSAFNHLLLTTEEGGAQPKDYEARMLTDRVRAVGSVWLGQTLGCAACHDHKFDPITSRDFYSMGAFFADIREPIIGKREEGILVPNERQAAELERLEEPVRQLQAEYDADHPELAGSFAAWQEAQSAAIENERFWKVLRADALESKGGATLEMQQNGAVLVKGKKPDQDVYTLAFPSSPNPISGLRLEALPHDSLPGKGSGRAANGNFVVTEILASIARADGRTDLLSFSHARASFEQSDQAGGHPDGRWSALSTFDGDARGDSWGWAILPDTKQPQQLILELSGPVTIEAGDTLNVEIRQNHGKGSHALGHFRMAASSSLDAVRNPLLERFGKEIKATLAKEDRSDAEKEKLFAHFKATSPALADLRERLAAAKAAKTEFEKSVARCLVTVKSDKPRAVRILPRGNFLVETGEKVEPALPAYLAKETPERKLTRLDLAEWLVSRDNPLTARVTVNRLWKQFFGTGLSKVLDDFGAQGEPPPNQALLDWLACEFMDSGWDTKHIVRLIVNSRAYQQSSQAPGELRARDPFNRELVAQSRWRLDAELVRDNALAVSGLLVPVIGGPSVKPYQPDGYWENLNFPQRTWTASDDAGQYRRGLYTWWQRSFPHPSMIAFDAPTREECAAERNRSNIPQQALVLLNDPTYVEASRVFASRILAEGGDDAASRLGWAWRQALSRSPRVDEIAMMRTLLEKHLAEYRADPAAADALLAVGLKRVPDGCDKPELAAWTSLARVLFNLHETVTRS
jgi:hypothetical protein